MVNPCPGLLLLPIKGRCTLRLRGDPLRPIHSRLWFWCGQHAEFDLSLPALGELMWFLVPSSLPGFCPLFSRYSRPIMAGTPIMPIVDLLKDSNLPYELRRVALFGRSLDLLAHVFQHQRLDRTHVEDDAARLSHARRLLLSKLVDPPTIPQLADQVGLNECKLKSMFKNAFGVTIHGFVKEERLMKARELLSSSELQVSEAAWAVGCENCGHFARAFRERFGCLPSRLEQHSSARE